ncbi:MAG: hypothetical protein JEZ11_24610 [Desulfobacterales bacterium]|nr:hypothetical protein [Desulfobacterales bacterium]
MQKMKIRNNLLAGKKAILGSIEVEFDQDGICVVDPAVANNIRKCAGFEVLGSVAPEVPPITMTDEAPLVPDAPVDEAPLTDEAPLVPGPPPPEPDPEAPAWAPAPPPDAGRTPVTAVKKKPGRKSIKKNK